MFDEKSILILFLSTIIVVSLIFNTFSIYSYKRIKQKISAHYICLNIYIINILFSLICIPSYILKEVNIIKNAQLESIFSFLNDFISFFYNDLLLLIALDRYFFICTQIRFNGKLITLIYYSFSFLKSSTSVSRLFEKSLRENNFSNVNDSLFEYGKEATLFYDKYFFISMITFDTVLQFVAYCKIFTYVYRKSSHARSYLPIIVVNFQKSLNKRFLWVNGHNQELSSHSSVENIKVSNIVGGEKTLEYKKCKNEFNYNMIHFRIFKNTHHWIITLVFIRVSLYNILFKLFYLLN